MGWAFWCLHNTGEMVQAFVLLLFGLFLGAGDASKRCGRLVPLEESNGTGFEVDFLENSHDTT